MSEHALDPTQVQEAVYDLADQGAAAITPAALRALAERLEGGQPTPAPAAATEPAQAQPPAAGPPTVEQLQQQLPEVRRRIVEAELGGDHVASRDAVWEFANGFNQAMDREAQERAPHLYGRPEQPPDLGSLQQRLREAALDPAAVGEKGIDALVGEYNQAVERIRGDAERDQEAFAQRVRAQRAQPSTAAGGRT